MQLIGLGQRLLRNAIGQENSIRRRQLGIHDFNLRIAPFLTATDNVNATEERLIEAALDRRIGAPIDLAYVVGQLQGHAKQRGVKIQLPLSRR